MFKIGEFSKLTQVSIRMLRYYDETGLLKPAQTDPSTGYRLYSAEQIPRLNRILFLRDTGFGISEILQVLAQWDGNRLTARLREKSSEIQKNIQSEQARLDKITKAIEDIGKERITLHSNVIMKAIASYQVLSLRRIIPDYYAEGALWKELAHFANENKIAVTGETFSIYHDPDYKETEVDVELCAFVTQKGENQGDFVYRQTEAVAMMASTMVYGDFTRIASAYLTFAGWLQENQQYRMLGTSRQIVHRGPWNEEDPENYLTELQIPLECLSNER